MLRQISDSVAVDLCKVDVIKNNGGKSIVYINGRDYESVVDYDLLLSMVNEEKEDEKRERKEKEESVRIIKTTSDSKFAG